MLKVMREETLVRDGLWKADLVYYFVERLTL